MATTTAPALDPKEMSFVLEDTTPIPAVPPSPSGWYRVFTPAAGYQGTRYGIVFVQGETVVNAAQTWATPLPGQPDQVRRVVDLFAQDLHYRVEAIPEGVPPVPTYTLGALG